MVYLISIEEDEPDKGAGLSVKRSQSNGHVENSDDILYKL